MDVESLSVSEINRRIGLCPHLKAYINKNDKTPFTDGHIDLYRDLPQSNATCDGRVPVQVKGRTYKKLQTARQTWGISRTDLLAHKRESGVLYFFVRVDRVTGECASYFVNLAPFKIEALLNTAGPEARFITIALERLPDDPTAVEAILRLALRTREQNPEAGLDLTLLERAEGFTLYSASKQHFDKPGTIDLSSGAVALVLHTAGGMSVPLPGELQIIPGDYTKHPVPFRVSAGTVTYDDVYRQRLDEETFELSLGGGVTLTLRDAASTRSMSASYRSEGSLADRLKTLEFMQALAATGTIEVDGKSASLGKVIGGELTDSMEYAHAGLRRLAELFDSLGVDTDLVDLDSISHDDFSQLSVLYRAFIEGEEVVGDLPKSGFVLQRVGRWRLMVLAQTGSAPGRWRLVDAFSPDFRRQFWAQPEAEGSELHPITPYDLIEPEHLPLVLNLRLGSIVGAYEAITDWPGSTLGHANLRVLALITAGDACEDRRDEFLDAATKLNEWLLAVEGAEPHHLVNRWQILHRRGSLTSEHRHEIRELRHQMAGDNARDLAALLEVACAILLDESEEVDYLVSHLSQEDLDKMQKWPIWALRGQ